MAVEIVPIDINNPNIRDLQNALRVVREGGVIVYPTDTIYGLGANPFKKEALEKVLHTKKASKHKLLSLILPDLKGISQWANLSDGAYRLMKRVVPGPYTFILKATKEVPKTLFQKRPTIGIRIPDAPIPLTLCRELGHPLLNTSVPLGEDDYHTNPEEIAELFAHEIDLVLHGGTLANLLSSVVDLSEDSPKILREGAGDTSLFR